MTKHLRLAGAIVCGCLMWPANAGADPVTDWNVKTAKRAEKCICVKKTLVLKELCVFRVQCRDQY